jgi:hypothetical protein
MTYGDYEEQEWAYRNQKDDEVEDQPDFVDYEDKERAYLIDDDDDDDDDDLVDYEDKERAYLS